MSPKHGSLAGKEREGSVDRSLRAARLEKEECSGREGDREPEIISYLFHLAAV